MSVDYRPDYDPADVDSDYGHTGGNITVPTFTGDTRPFRFWCQKALPLVYDDSLSYYEVLCKMADYMNNFVTDLTTVEDSMTEFGQQFVINQQFLNDMADQLGQNVADLEAYINDRMDDFMTAYTQLQTYVNNYFDNLDVQQEINTKLDEMASDGTLNDLFDPVLETWMHQKTAQIDAAIANQDTMQAAQNARISVLEGRMDTFSGLPSGSTSGNAELLDIRTNFLGETYPTAGDAVRASDMIASGFQSISTTKLEDWDGNDDSSVYDTIQIDISRFKGGHVVVIGTFLYFQSDIEQTGTCSVYATNTPGKVEDANAVNCFPGGTNSIFTNYTQIPTSISGEERLLLQFAIPDDYTYQYLKIGHIDGSALQEQYTEPLYIVYANSWSKTEVDPTLSIAGDAADAKATGDALDELNERLGNIDSELTTEITQSTQYITFAFETGSQYMLINGTDSSMNAHTMSAPNASGTAIEAIGTNVQAGQSVIFTPTANASYARFYCNGRGSVTVKNISYGVPKLEIAVSALQANAETYVQKNGFQQVNERNTTFFTQTANLFNKETVVDNYDLMQNGSGLYAATGYMATEEYIDVSNLNSIKPLVINNGAVTAASIRYVLYDANKTALNQRTITNAVLDTSNASYLRFGASLGQKDTLMIVPGDVEVSEYIPYGFTFNYTEENEVTLVKINPTDDIIQKLLDNKGKDIYFNAGEYDIIAQYEEHFGSDYFTNYTDYTSGGDNLGRGLPVYRDTKVTFSQGAVFSANYTGDNTAVRNNFSAFWLESGVTVDGLRMSASGIRNIIHDDFDNTYNGITVIKNCHLTCDTNVIAGGLGLHETVIIENCYIERTTGTPTYDFSYHNNGNAGAQNLLVVKDNYLNRGFSVRWYGPSTLLTDVLVSNNSMAYEVDIHAENANATVENINLKTWNNEIRS